jgi:serine/threonine protein kinase
MLSIRSTKNIGDVDIPSPEYDKEEAEFLLDERTPYTPGTPYYPKYFSLASLPKERTDVFGLLKDVFKDPEASQYLSPVLAQYQINQNVVQLLSVEGKALLDESNRITVGAAELPLIQRQAGEILAFLKSKRLVHRDIKPENMIWNETEKRVKLIDLDSMIRLPEGKDVYQSYEFRGSPGFVPPEAVTREGVNWSFATDAYAMQITLTQLRQLGGHRRRNRTKRRKHLRRRMSTGTKWKGSTLKRF